MPLRNKPKQNQWNRKLNPTKFIENNLARKSHGPDFERAYAKRARRALRDTTLESDVGQVRSKRLFKPETTILHTHPPSAYKVDKMDSLINGAILRLVEEKKTKSKKGTYGALMEKLETARKKMDFQRPLPSPQDLATFFLKPNVRTDMLIIMDVRDPRKVAGYVAMRKVKPLGTGFQGGIRVENIRRSLFLAAARDLESKEKPIREAAKRRLAEYYPNLFRGLVNPLEKRDITAKYLANAFNDLKKLGIRTRLVPNTKNGYSYVNGQFKRK